MIQADLNGQALASASPAPGQNSSAADGPHAQPESVNTEAASLFWLVCTFWHLLRKFSGLLKNNLTIIGAGAVRSQARYFGFCTYFLDGSSRRS